VELEAGQEREVELEAGQEQVLELEAGQEREVELEAGQELIEVLETVVDRQELKEELEVVADRQERKREVLQEVVVVAWVELAMDKGPKQEAEQEPEGIAEAGRELAKGTEA
jgi:hypothetical protein